MSNHKASIAIFEREIEYPKGSRPLIPDDIFEAAQKVVQEKGCKVVKSRNGLYIIQYSESGPWQDARDDFLPVWIARVSSWSSGGITKMEMDQYVIDKEKDNES